MLKTPHVLAASVFAAALAAFISSPVLAQSKSKKGAIICWKDKSGKVVGCGDTVPPEFADNATKELDKRGITRRTTETAAERAKREVEEDAQKAQKAAEKKRLAEQGRQDAALISTFSNAKEIDLKRDRDLQVVDGQLTQLRVSHKNAANRHNEAKSRIDAAAKSGKPAAAAQKEDLAQAEAAMAQAGQSVADKDQEKDEIRKRYADMKARYIHLRGGPAPAAPTAAVKK